MKTTLRLTIVAFGLAICAEALGAIYAAGSAKPENLSDSAVQQIRVLEQEKPSLSPSHRKLDSQFVFKLKQNRGQGVAAGVSALRVDVQIEADGRVLVDIDANVT